MPHKNEQQEWERYREQGLEEVSPILKKLGFILEQQQPHIHGERYLMQAITTTHGKKIILLGRRAGDGKRVVIKTASDHAGARELVHERQCREVLHKINFAYDVFFSPEEILFERHGSYLIAVYAFLEQECPFLERPLEEQFTLAVKAFKAQESAHAATYEQRRLIKRTFGNCDGKSYVRAFKKFEENILTHLPEQGALAKLLQRGKILLQTDINIIEQYSQFLTHIDFVPHNFRVVEGNIYLLDHSSMRFGNKYEGWARFVNFMTLYNQPLAETLTTYVRDNRTGEESRSLRLMRVYRLGEIIWYYTNTLNKTSGDLRTLNRERIKLWTGVLKAVLDDTKVSEGTVEAYKNTRDALRTKEEKQRQVGLH